MGGHLGQVACVPPHRPSLPEVNGAEPNEHPREHCGLLPQHDGPIVIKPPVGQNVAVRAFASTTVPTPHTCARLAAAPHLVVRVSRRAVEMYSDMRFSISATRIQARPCKASPVGSPEDGATIGFPSGATFTVPRHPPSCPWGFVVRRQLVPTRELPLSLLYPCRDPQLLFHPSDPMGSCGVRWGCRRTGPRGWGREGMGTRMGMGMRWDGVGEGIGMGLGLGMRVVWR